MESGPCRSTCSSKGCDDHDDDVLVELGVDHARYTRPLAESIKLDESVA